LLFARADIRAGRLRVFFAHDMRRNPPGRARRITLAALLCALPPAPTPAPATPPAAPSESAQRPAKSTSHTLALQKSTGSAAVDREIDALQRAAEKATDKKVDPWILLGRAWIRKARESSDPGFYLNAAACADIVLGFEPKNLEQHAFTDAKDLADQILAEAPDDIMALGTKSDAALELGRFDEASESAQRMMDLKPNLPSYARAAHLRWLQGDLKAAKAFYRQAMDAHDPHDPEPYAWVLTQAALVFWHEGDVEGADAGFDRALLAVPDYPAALIGKARVALAQGDPKRAVELAERAYKKAPLAEQAWVLGEAKKAAGNREGADEAFALAEKHGRAGDGRTLAQLLTAQNRGADEAVSLARKEVAFRKDIYTRDTLAWALYRSGKLEEARAESDVALALGTKDATLLYHAGAIRIAQGERAAGEKLVREALKTNPHFDPNGAAEARKLLGDPPHAAP
jgi:tetratricopeptide (TPR) repeat protein